MSFSFDVIPEEHRCYVDGPTDDPSRPAVECFFGVGKQDIKSSRSLRKIPANATGFNFLMGSAHLDLFSAFCDSDLPASTQLLSIGNTSCERYDGVDYTELTAVFLKHQWPKLERFELGEWHLLCNSGTAYGTVGCLDSLSVAAPNLRYLNLNGKIKLTSPLSLPHLKSLQLCTSDTVDGTDGSQIDPETLLHLLSSSMPKLSELYVGLGDFFDREDESGPLFNLPQTFFHQDSFPDLMKLEITGRFRAEAKEALLQSPISARKDIALFLDDMYTQS